MASLILLFPGGASAAGGGDGFDNGGGLGEQNVAFASMKFSWLLQPCWDTALCRLSKPEQELLFSLLYSDDNSFFPELRFESGTLQPELFRRSGYREVRMMNTEPSLNSPIYINIDLLYTEDEFGNLVPISINEALWRLLVEVAYQKGYTQLQIQTIIDRINLFLNWPAEEVYVRRYRKLRDVHLKAYKYTDKQMTFAFADGNEIHDVDALIRRTMMCVNLSEEIEADNILLRNIRWRDRYRRSDDVDRATNKFYILMPLVADVEYECPFASGTVRFRGKVELELAMRFLKGRAQLIEMSDEEILLQYFIEGSRGILRDLRRI